MLKKILNKSGFLCSDFIILLIACVVTGIIAATAVTIGQTKNNQSRMALKTEDAFTIGMNPNRDYLILVNGKHGYEFNGDYDRALQNDLIYVADCSGEPTPLEKGANLALSMLQAKLHENGTEIALYSGYRTKEDQQWVYDYYGKLKGWAETNTVSKPGFSEHHTGLLLNIVIWADGGDGKMLWVTETAERQAEHPEFKIVHETLADFGFIDRYPAGKETITGVSSEPYEIRFVGSSKIAHEIMDNNLCLEEYLENLESK